MDMQEFGTDLKAVAKKLPKEMVAVIVTLVDKFGPELEKLVPELMGTMGRHMQAIMFEAGCGMLDKDELSKTVVTTLNEVLK